MIRVLIKKEIKDFITSFKCLFVLFMASWAPSLYFNVNNEFLSAWVHMLLTQMVVGQFLFDSYRADIKNGGIQFFINMKANFIIYYFVKYIFLVIPILIPICFNIKQWCVALQWYEFFWYFLSLFYCGAIMFIMQIISKGEEIATAFIVTIIMAVILFFVYSSPIYLRFIEVIVLDVLFLFICIKLYNSILFRKQI